MRSIKINNPVLNSYITDLSDDYSTSDTTTLSVRSNNSFAANDLLVIGNPSEELTEQKKITAIPTGQVTLASTLNFAHNKGTPVYKSIWDFISLEGRSSSAGVFAELTQSPIQWDSKINKTIYFHSAGTDTWEYRFRFYNSVSGLYSEYSPTLSGLGFTKYQMGYIIRGARRTAGDKDGRILKDDELLEAATRAKNIIRAHNATYWFWKVDGKQAGISISAIADTNVYSLADISDMAILNYLEYRYTNNGSDRQYILMKKNDLEFAGVTRDLRAPVNDLPRIFRLLPPDENSDKGYFQINTTIQNNSVGIFYPNYYREEPDYNSIDDRTSIIMPQIIQDYLVSEIYATKGNEALAEKYYGLFTGPEGRKKTQAIEKLSGIALLDELDKQYKDSKGQPKNLWSFRGQKAVSRLMGSRLVQSADYYRENYFDESEY